VFLDERLEVHELAALEVLRLQELLLAHGPGLVDLALVLELLGQVVEALEAHELGEEPLLEAALGELEALPGAGDVADELALAGQVGRPVAEAQLGLEGGEVGLEFGLLLELGRLLDAAVVAELAEFLLGARQCVVGQAGLEPGGHTADPFEELWSKGVKEKKAAV